jgi:hypothetical protein
VLLGYKKISPRPLEFANVFKLEMPTVNMARDLSRFLGSQGHVTQTFAILPVRTNPSFQIILQNSAR